ncbi:MAG TPA: phosphotransferase [Bacillota bacterium]|nr:phosphotransferase [Bacillota bacterium]
MGPHWILQTNHQPAFFLKELTSDSVHARHVWRSLKFLAQKGILSHPTWLETVQGEPFWEWHGSQWVLTPWFSGSPAAIYTHEGLSKLLRLLSQIHIAGTDCPHGEYFIPYNSFGKRLSDLELIPSIESSGTFAQNYRELLPYYLETGRQAILIIKASLPEKGFKATICHGDPSSRNILCLPDGRWVLLDWDRLVRAPRWWELSQVIRRFQNQNAWKEWPLWDSIHKHVKPLLQPDETTALLGCLLFPQEFWRLGDQYFQEKLNRPESWFLRRLETLQRLELHKNLTLLKWARFFDISVQPLKSLVIHN